MKLQQKKHQWEQAIPEKWCWQCQLNAAVEFNFLEFFVSALEYKEHAPGSLESGTTYARTLAVRQTINLPSTRIKES